MRSFTPQWLARELDWWRRRIEAGYLFPPRNRPGESRIRDVRGIERLLKPCTGLQGQHDLVVFSVIRNGISNGYPFVEAYGSWFDYCDRIFVLEGGSTDGTEALLSHLSRIDPKFCFARDTWPDATSAGTSIAEFTNRCLATVRSHARRLVYVQADEIFGRETRAKLRSWDKSALKFYNYVHFWTSFDKVLRYENDDSNRRSTSPWKAIRAFPAGAEARATGDACTFELSGAPVVPCFDEVFHYGWVFPVNILQKHLNHARLYRDMAIYRRRARRAAWMLRHGVFAPELLEAVDPRYPGLVRPFSGDHPECVRHLIGQQSYDPYVGFELLRSGVRW